MYAVIKIEGDQVVALYDQLADAQAAVARQQPAADYALGECTARLFFALAQKGATIASHRLADGRLDVKED